MNHALYLEDLRGALFASPPLDGLRGRRVLVTGASGLIGSFLVDMLMLANREMELGARVCALSRSRERLRRRFAQHLDEPGFELLALDVADGLDDAGAFDYVIHAASPAHPLAFSTDPVGTMRANLLGTLHLLEQLRAQGAGRLLFVSSGEIYGERRAVGSDFTEDSMGYIDCASPRACYPESKRAAETLCVSFASQHGVDAVIARPCHVYGPAITDENSRADAQFLRSALDDGKIVMKSAGAQVRSYLYVADAAAALMWVLLRGERAQAYNLANPDSVLSIRQYAEALAACVGVPIELAEPGERERAGYSQVSRATLCADKLLLLGFKPRFSARAGIERMLTIARD